MGHPTGILLVNLGTPDSPETGDVRRYLREFLSDPRVIDISPVARWLLLHLVILPFRPAKSGAAYAKVWMKEGSPLLVHGRSLTEAVRKELSDLDVHVELAMRYGNPSIRTGLEALRAAGCDRVIVMPLYPQYAASSTGSTIEAVHREVADSWNTPFVTVIPPFYDDARFIAAFAAVGRPVLDEHQPDHVLFSFHGLPERQIQKSDFSGTHCLRRDDCCDTIAHANRNCYRAQSFATARALAEALELPEERYSVTFQSRLGRDPWIQPFTDHALLELPNKGVKTLAVFCPAFVADCLETLEEIAIRGAEDFQAAGGKELVLVPSLNASPAWVSAVTSMLRDHLPASRS